MSKVTLELDNRTVEKLVEKLPMKDKIKLVRSLERETWGKRMDELLNLIDKRRKKHPISRTEINKEIASIRRELYGPRRS